MRHGVPVSPAARLKRRADVNSTCSSTPSTTAALAALRPSSIAFRTSQERAVSTMTRCEGSKPRCANPAADGRPNSLANVLGQHHSTQGWASARHGESISARRMARRAANPIAAIQSAAEAPPDTDGRPLISWTEFVSRPFGSSSWSDGQPSSQRKVDDRGAASPESAEKECDAGPRRGACRSKLRMRERSLAITAALTEPSGHPANVPGGIGWIPRPDGAEEARSDPMAEVLRFKESLAKPILKPKCSLFVLNRDAAAVKPSRQKTNSPGIRHPTATPTFKLRKKTEQTQSLEHNHEGSVTSLLCRRKRD